MKIELVKHTNEITGTVYSVEQNGEVIEASKSHDLKIAEDIFDLIVERRKRALENGFTSRRTIKSIEL